MIDFSSCHVLPAVTLDDAAFAAEVAAALYAGGVRVMEIAFRTPAAATSIRAIRSALPDMEVGAGTLLSATQLAEATEAGAAFGLSPGFNPGVIREASRMGFPFIPGVLTPGEIERCLEAGYTTLKLFPAGPAGGPSFLRALLGPYRHTGVRFIPMGGVTVSNMVEYLSVENVVCVGGSWLAPPELIRERRWDAITAKAREAMALR